MLNLNFGVKDKELINKTLKIIRKAHKNQLRRDGSSYIIHPIVVALIVHKITKDTDLTVAALLHDTIEDTDITYEYLAKEFSNKIADLVVELTLEKEQKILLGKKNYLVKCMNKMSDDALIIKLSDRLHNVSELNLLTDVGFIKKYYKETVYILSNLNKDLSKKHLDLIRKIRIHLLPLKIKYSI